MLGIFRLDQHLARPLGASGATGDLHDRLRQSLAGAEVRAEQALVGVQHDDQRDVRKVMALGQHLRADEDADLVAIDARQRRFELAAPAHAVAVDARERRVREQLPDRFLDALRALSDRLRTAGRSSGTTRGSGCCDPQ